MLSLAFKFQERFINTFIHYWVSVDVGNFTHDRQSSHIFPRLLPHIHDYIKFNQII